MDAVAEFVDQDVLGRVRIAAVVEQVLLRATDNRSSPAGAQPAGSHVPVGFGLHVAMLGNIRRPLGIGHHGNPDLVLDQSVADIGPMSEHLVDQVGRLAQAKSDTFAEPTMGRP